MRIDCPICKKTLETAPDDFEPRPFCSTRCKMVDLGNWLSEAYRIPLSGGRSTDEHDESDHDLS
jgi:endogenous inhibitor of DNA gyrase (YacG/DUF329 family)